MFAFKPHPAFLGFAQQPVPGRCCLSRGARGEGGLDSALCTPCLALLKIPSERRQLREGVRGSDAAACTLKNNPVCWRRAQGMVGHERKPLLVHARVPSLPSCRRWKPPPYFPSFSVGPAPLAMHLAAPIGDAAIVQALSALSGGHAPAPACVSLCSRQPLPH